MQLDQNALEAACEAYDAVVSSNPRVAYAVSVGMKRAIRAYLQAVQPVPVAWQGYWPGAGSINSVTRLTRFRAEMEEWKADGAEITPLAPVSGADNAK